MAARVLHFGWDDCYRIPVLSHAGYVVTEAKTLEALALDLQKPVRAEAVFVSEHNPKSACRAAEIVRTYSKAPLILFGCSPSAAVDKHMFDQVYPRFVPPQIWLTRTAELIAKSQALQELSARLRLESQAVRRESRAGRVFPRRAETGR